MEYNPGYGTPYGPGYGAGAAPYSPGYGTPVTPAYGYGCGCGTQQPIYQGGYYGAAYGGYGRGSTFALVLVLFILLVIIGATRF